MLLKISFKLFEDGDLTKEDFDRRIAKFYNTVYKGRERAQEREKQLNAKNEN